MKTRSTVLYVALAIVVAILFPATARASSVERSTAKSSPHVSESASAQRRIGRLRRARLTRHSRRHRFYQRYYTSSFAGDLTEADAVGGEDPVVRQAAIDALGNMNGTVVAIDPSSGRILAMVNQKLALGGGAQPCSTIKLVVALAALNEHVVERDTEIRLGRRYSMNLTEALAHSNNAYFEALGRQLGFEKISHYAREFGLGELAGYNIDGEHLGVFPTQALASKLGGVGKMCSFGESIAMTPLQLGALVSAIANDGTLYYLQHPQSAIEVTNFQPKIKRQLEIAGLIPAMKDGMMGAVLYGTARSVRYNFSEEQILGKTGTCSNNGTRYGWFASYTNTDYGRIVTVVFLQGGRPTFGPKAAEIAGRMYRNLYDHSFFTAATNHETADHTATAGVSQ